MLIAPDTISLSMWLEHSSISPATRRNRRYVVAELEKTNEQSIEAIFESIKSDKVTVYSIVQRYLDYMRKSHTPYTTYVHRSIAIAMFESTLGEENARRRTFDRLCPGGAVYVSQIKMCPSKEQLLTMLKMSSPSYKAVLAVLSISGMRIGEALSRKWTDLEICNEGFAKVNLRANETKARYRRHTFLTKEVVDMLKILPTNNSGYIFEGHTGGHLGYVPTEANIKELYARAGLIDASDRSEIYTSHSLRTFASDWLRECGLGEKYCLAIVGHKNKLGAEGSYLDWNRIESEWKIKCSEKMVFFSEKPKDYERVKDENSDLKALLAAVLKPPGRT